MPYIEKKSGNKWVQSKNFLLLTVFLQNTQLLKHPYTVFLPRQGIRDNPY